MGSICVKGVKTQDSLTRCKKKKGDQNGGGPSESLLQEIKEEMGGPDMMDEPAFKPPPKRGRRQAVAAESYDPMADDDKDENVIFYTKTDEQLKCLQEAASNIIFFKKCDKEQRQVLFNAMFEKKVTQGETIIRQGDDGDNFYVIDKGEYDIFVKDSNGEEKKVASLTEGFFGELALLYNCPRNATIVSASDYGVLWGLDQKTFRQVVVKATARKRAVFEELLKGVSMLDSLQGDELMNLTDALDEVSYAQEQEIIREGDAASEMYFIMQGKAVVRAMDKNTKSQKDIVELDRGQYFGELALVLKKPRVASVFAMTENTKCAVLDINAFERLLGPCVDIMKRNIEKYEEERKRLGINSISENQENGNVTKSMTKLKIK
ncbi:cAMP-dependent protein kinase type II regulatory subunit-like isoform X2 [Clytia hemisphaerica]|uniref:Cyclic nucleotide-binding domain-containing protein n=1 Tax=Clytia hemisphaerica TaxID=252671 RepID=A0A7M5WYU4_9CNID